MMRNNEKLCATNLHLWMNAFVQSFVWVSVCMCARFACVCVRETEREQDGMSLGDILNPFVETGTVISECVCVCVRVRVCVCLCV